VTAISAIPPDADALAWFPADNARPDCVDHADHFMAGNARVLDAGE
jgi:hypothetical protein